MIKLQKNQEERVGSLFTIIDMPYRAKALPGARVENLCRKRGVRFRNLRIFDPRHEWPTEKQVRGRHPYRTTTLDTSPTWLFVFHGRRKGEVYRLGLAEVDYDKKGLDVKDSQ